MNRQSPIYLGIYRTDHQKYITNFGDGSGKDTYAINNNGGLRHDKEMWGSKGKPLWNSNVTGNDNNVPLGSSMYKAGYGSFKKEMANVYYQPDGTGRDTYVIKGNGGT